MTTKRKTQLNLSGSHRNVDADIVFVGSNLFVTGSAQFTGSLNLDSTLSASGQVSTAGAFFVQGATQLTGAVNLAAGLSASGNITAAGIFSGSTGRFTYLSGALSASSTGQPFIVAGSNVTTTFSPTDLNWTIAATGGGGGSVAGSDTQVQFNENGAFAASSSLTHTSGTLGVHAISGSLTSSGTVFGDIGYNSNILKINTNVLVTQSAMLFDGVDSALEFEFGGVLLANGASLAMFSGSLGEDPPFDISRAETADSVDVHVKGAIVVKNGSISVNSGSKEDRSFSVEPSTTAGQVNVIFDRTGSTEGVEFQGINVRPLYSFQNDIAGTGFLMPGDLLSTGNAGGNSIGKIDFNVIAVSKDSNNYASWTFSTTVARDTAGATSVIAYSELDAATSGSAAATWDVNVNSNATIACTGSFLAATNTIRWYAQITKKMFVSGSGLITY